MYSRLHLIALAFGMAWTACSAQDTQSIFAHNDYLKPNPFHGAYQQRVGYIEVDVFLSDNDLLVAHTRNQIKPGRNLEVMYLKPLAEEVRKNNGFAYPDSALSLRLMIDIKTDAAATLQKLVEILNHYPELVSCRNLFLTISGNMPAPKEWSTVPQFIYFDGRPELFYDKEQLKRVPLISTSFRNYSRWNGKGELDDRDRAKLKEVIDGVHVLGKPIRFWATPDTSTAWEQLSWMGVDVINTDDVAGVAEFLGK